MKTRKPKAKPQLIAQFDAEALQLAGALSGNQRRFLAVGLLRGKELEPAGLMAGSRG